MHVHTFSKKNKLYVITLSIQKVLHKLVSVILNQVPDKPGSRLSLPGQSLTPST